MYTYKELEDTEKKYEELINIAKKIMSEIIDKEHDINHIYDVVEFVKLILSKIDFKVNIDVCIISAYWHDVGRSKLNEGHEKVSAEMLKENMKKMKYESGLIDECYKAIEFHKWNMNPTTKEGLILKDADKLGWIGKRRWKTCLDNNYRLDSIMEKLPDLRDSILYFKESKEIYDEEIINFKKELKRRGVYENNKI